MAADDLGEKTLPATPRRLEEARRKGNIARSTDLTTAGVMLVAAFVLWSMGDDVTVSLTELTRRYLSEVQFGPMDRDTAAQHLFGLMGFLAETALPFLLVMFMAAIVFNVIQFGFLLTNESLAPQLSRISPLAGVQRIFSMRGVMKLLISLLKLTVLAGASGWFLWSHLPEFFQLDDDSPLGIAGVLGDNITSLAFLLAGILIALAIVDFAFQKWKHSEELKMSVQEVKDEMKQMNGDPHVKQRQQETHQKIAKSQEMTNAAGADVLITNPTHLSIAIKYDPLTMPAPIVVAKGEGELAFKLREIAAENGIPIIERKPLAQALYREVDVGSPIPEEMYKVFVEIMAYVYRITGKEPPSLS